MNDCSQEYKNKCIYCSKTYKLKKNFNAHFATCELLHSTQSMTSDDYTNLSEKTPSPKEMFKLLKDIAAKCKSLEHEVAILKQNANIKQRKHILDWLNTNKNGAIPFKKWYNSIHIDFIDIQKVFDTNLTEGIKHILKNAITDDSDSRPLYAFTQKANYIYVYDEVSNENTSYQWTHFTNKHCEDIVQHISRYILIEFIKWQKDNQGIIANDESMKDREIEYMIKINGSKIPLEKRIMEIKKWMFSTLQEDIYEHIIEF